MIARARPVALKGLLVLLAAFAAPALPAPALAAAGWTWPVVGEVITPYHNGDDPYAGGQHRGIDIAADTGTPVAAAAAGTVRFAGVAGSSGLTVSVRTTDGRFDTSYLHLSAVAVREGDRVGADDRIGAAGTSGRRSAAAPHLHFGVREAGSRHAYRDPLDFLPPQVPGPVREGPRAAPVPVGVPVRVSPAPEPVRTPSPSRLRRRAPARRRIRLPAGRRVRVPEGGRAPRAVLPNLSPVPVSAPVPAAAPRPFRGGRAPHAPRTPALGPGPAVAPRPQAAPAHRLAGQRTPIAEPGGAPDLGWALACAALLLAAACLGRPTDRQRGAERGRVALRALLRPLTGGG